MTDEPTPHTDRWNVNLPAVVGIVFVFLLGVVVWVVTSDGSDGDDDAGPVTTIAAVQTTAPVTAPATTSPAPMPDLTATTTTPPPTSVTVTTAPGADAGSVAGDLAIDGRAMQAPPCNDSFITVIASAVGGDASAVGIASVLDQYPGSNYLRTDQTCPSLTPDIDGEPIYVVYFGPFPFAADACAARAEGTQGSYARQLSETLGPGHGVSCDG